MSIRQYFSEICKSELCILTLNDEEVGMRASVYNTSTNSMDYCDFSMSLVKDKKLISFVDSVKDSLRVLPFLRFEREIKTPDGNVATQIVMMTQEEKDSKLLVKEFKTTEEVETMLKRVQAVYDNKS